MAAAHAGRRLRMPVTVFVPETTSELMVEKIKNERANIIVKGKVMDCNISYLPSLAPTACDTRLSVQSHAHTPNICFLTPQSLFTNLNPFHSLILRFSIIVVTPE